MWHFAFIFTVVEGGLDKTGLEAAARQRYENATSIIHISPEKVGVFVPANVTDEQAAILAESSKLIPGSGVLQWFEPWMAKDAEDGWQAAEKARQSIEENPLLGLLKAMKSSGQRG